MSCKKGFIITGSILLFLVLGVFVLSHFVAICTPFNKEGNGIFAIVFDKNDVVNADKIIIRDGEQVITITDIDTVREIASEFVVANSIGLCGYYDDKWMEIYNGDKIVRNIHWNDHEELVVVYDTDITHMVWPDYEYAQIQLSDEFIERLSEIIEEYS